MLYRTFVSLILLLSISSSAYSQVRLEHKLQEGTSHTTSLSSTIDQKLVIAGMDTQTNVETTTTSKLTIGKRDGLGMLRAQEKVESLQVNMSAQGLQYTFDSANPDKKGDSPLEFLRDIHKGLLGSVSTIVYDKDNRVHAVETDQNLLASLPEAAKEMVKGQLDPEELKTKANQDIDQLPTEPVSKGDTWVRTENANFGAGQVMTFQTEYTYQGTIEKDGRTLDKITSKILTVMFTLQANSPLPFKLKGSELKATETEGTLLFDRAKGQIVESSSANRITGDIGFTVNDMDLPSKLDLKMKVTASSSVK
jgi:hypothetical protein